MKILFIAAEVSPLVKAGGLGDVIGSLPRALAKLGHDVRVVIPRYGSLETGGRQTEPVIDCFLVPMMGRFEPASLQVSTHLGDTPIYLVGNDRLFGGNVLYGDNDLERFFFFSRAIVEVLPQLAWQPDIVHCHDWHGSLALMWLKNEGHSYATMFTIHNLAYQGFFDTEFMEAAELGTYWEKLPPGAPEPPRCFMSQGILWADMVSTVSETYAREILTPVQGVGLDPILRYREKDLVGIVNGIDYDEYNPETDKHLAANFSWNSLENRVKNKLAVQGKFHLPENPEIPLIGMVQRLDEQKGLDIFVKAADAIITGTGVQLVILGKGREYYETVLRQITARFDPHMALYTYFDNPLAHLVYGGCDIFLMPSRFEPCGLGQLIAMRYGAIPVVRRTGGLADTVPPFNADLSDGRGFVFDDYTPQALSAAVIKAVNALADESGWEKALQRVMKLDFSWDSASLKYDSAYRQLMDNHQESNKI